MRRPSTIILSATLSAAVAAAATPVLVEDGRPVSEIVVSCGIFVNSFHNIDDAQWSAAEELQRWIGEMTDAFADTSMCEYMDSVTGFRMQYPSVFQFDDYGTTAATADGKATLSIDNMSNTNGLDEATLLQAIKLEIPNAEPQKNEQNGCLRFDRETDGGANIQTDLYFLTEKSFHLHSGMEQKIMPDIRSAQNRLFRFGTCHLRR